MTFGPWTQALKSTRNLPGSVESRDKSSELEVIAIKCMGGRKWHKERWRDRSGRVRYRKT